MWERILDIVNYAFRFFLVIIGILILTDVVFPYYHDKTLKVIFGSILILLGVYRIIIYFFKKKRINNEKDNQEL